MRGRGCARVLLPGSHRATADLCLSPSPSHCLTCTPPPPTALAPAQCLSPPLPPLPSPRSATVLGTVIVGCAKWGLYANEAGSRIVHSDVTVIDCKEGEFHLC